MDLRDPTLPASWVIKALRLQPHPEGGHYRETWRDQPDGGGRGSGTAILFLLAAGESSHWHRVDADELWIWNAGSALELKLSTDGVSQTSQRLGPDLAAGDSVQGRVAPHVWQAAEPLGAWTLVTCTVTPAFEFAGFTMAPHGWEPG